MTRFNVDAEAVLGAAGTIAVTVANIQSEAASLAAQLTSLEASWSGQAAAAFQSVIADWRSTQQRVDESLSAIKQALSLAGQQYSEIELANARLFGR